MKRYGCIYKSRNGQEYLVTTNVFNEPWASSNLKSSEVMTFSAPWAVDNFMKRSEPTGNPVHSRDIDGEYRVIELEAFYVLAGWRVGGDEK